MKTLGWFILFYITTACVDQINFDIPPVEYQLVVDGTITDEPGPHTVYLYRAMALNADLDRKVPVFNAKVTLVSNGNKEELLTEVERGIYKTKSETKGEIGSSYKIQIQTSDGKKYESEPETILPPGTIDNIRYEFESNTVLQNGIETKADQFNVRIDATGVANSDNNIRWRLEGTYLIETYPHLKMKAVPGGGRAPDPLPCSGYEVRNGKLTQVSDCTCCYCWVNEYEEIPNISDDQFLQANKFNDVRAATIAVNQRTFFDKYYVEIQQMNLSPKAFNYWKLIKAQKEGASSLFQPPAAKLRGNVYNISDSKEEVQGYFTATAIYRKGTFISRKDVPYRIFTTDSLKTSCLYLQNSTTTKPNQWN